MSVFPNYGDHRDSNTRSVLADAWIFLLADMGRSEVARGSGCDHDGEDICCSLGRYVAKMRVPWQVSFLQCAMVTYGGVVVGCSPSSLCALYSWLER